MHPAVLPILLALLATTPAPASTPPASRSVGALASDEATIEALIDHVRQALLDPSDQRLDVLLRSLRRVRDPSLRPLFVQIAASERPILRVHGVLGLAELESPQRIDMLLVKRLADPRQQL